MRRYERTPVPVTLLMVLIAILAMPSFALAANKPVKIDITCRGGGNAPNTKVTPETVEVAQGQNVEWTLHINNSNKNDLTIEPKDPEHWPYVSKKVVGKNGKAKTLTMNPDAVGTYNYKILYKCDDTAYVIDPRIKVGGG